MRRIGYIVVVLLCAAFHSYVSAQEVDKKDVAPRARDGSAAVALSSHEKWGLIIGISKYDDEDINDLRYADADAKALYDLLVDPERGGFNKDNIFLLTSDSSSDDYKPTKGNILFYLSLLAENAKPEDTVIITYSGHGTEEKAEGVKYLLPMDAELKIIEAYGIDNKKFVEKIEKIKAKKVLIFLDCCHAGGISRSGKGPSGQRLSGGYYRAMAEAEGVITFASCKGDQVSFESPEDGHGIFTKYLLEALQGAADADRNGVATFKEVWDYVPGKVKQWSRKIKGGGRLQEPVMNASGATSLDIPISRCTIPGTLTLLVNLSQYHARIDGMSIASPVTGHNLGPGYYKIGVRARGYEKWQKTVEIISNRGLDLDVQLSQRSRWKASLKSTIWPGWGDFPDRKKSGVLMGILQIGAAAGAVWYHLDYRNNLEEYDAATKRFGDIENFPSYSEYESHYQMMRSKRNEVLNSMRLRDILLLSAVVGVRIIGAVESAAFMPGGEERTIVSSIEDGQITLAFRSSF